MLFKSIFAKTSQMVEKFKKANTENNYMIIIYLPNFSKEESLPKSEGSCEILCDHRKAQCRVNYYPHIILMVFLKPFPFQCKQHEELFEA